MPSISFLDSTGFATLTNGKSVPRVNAWTPKRVPIGPRVTGLGTGRIHMFEFRTDDLVSFSLDSIPGTDANMQIMLRLQAHLLRGGIVTLDAGRTAYASNWGTCSLAPDTEPEIQFSDRDALEYSFVATLRTSAPSTTDIQPPSFIPGLKLWLEADSLAASKVNNDFVSLWDDQSGNNNDAVQALEANQPIYITEALDGLPAIQTVKLGGVGGLNTPMIMNPCTNGSHFFMVAKRTTPHVEHGYFAWFGADSTNICESNGTPDNATFRWAQDNLGAEQTIGAPSTDFALVEIATAAGSGRQITPYFNGVAGTPFTAHTDWNQSRDLNIMDINGEVVLYLWWNAELGSDAVTVRRYVNSKYPSLAITLP